MKSWSNDNELFALMRNELYTPVVGDILDNHDRRHQFLPQPIRPLLPEMKVAGRAMPVLMGAVFGRQEKPFGKLTEALDDLKPGEIYVAGGNGGNSANWGEILTAAAIARGATGAVVDGYHRDTPKVLEQDFPVFSRGHYAQDSGPRMKILDWRCPVEIGGVEILNGDLIFGDIDGVLVIPGDIADTAIEEALEKARAEKVVRAGIEKGMSATAAFQKYGIL